MSHPFFIICRRYASREETLTLLFPSGCPHLTCCMDEQDPVLLSVDLPMNGQR